MGQNLCDTGAWGPGLWPDDTACDIRIAYREALEVGYTDEDAQAKVLSDFFADLKEVEAASVVWLALAASQRRLGRLDPDVKRHTIEVIDSGTDLQRWDHAPPMRKKWEAALIKLRLDLVAPQRERSKVRRPVRPTTSLNPGDVLAYRAPSNRQYLLAVRAVNATRYGTFPIVRLLDHEGTSLPEQIEKIRERPPGQKADQDNPAGPWWKADGQVQHKRAHDFLDHDFVLVGHISPPPAEAQERLRSRAPSYSSWIFWQRYLDVQDDLLTQRLPDQ